MTFKIFAIVTNVVIH